MTAKIVNVPNSFNNNSKTTGAKSGKILNASGSLIVENNNCLEISNGQHNNSGKIEVRRANKPLMEKRRRARINQSLAMLKTLILDSAKMDNTKHAKLEKADILELTVRHFQRHRSLDTPGLNKYKAGYSDCVKEIQRYLETPDAQTMTVMDQNIQKRLIRHLDSCITEIDSDICLSSPSTSNAANIPLSTLQSTIPTTSDISPIPLTTTHYPMNTSPPSLMKNNELLENNLKTLKSIVDSKQIKQFKSNESSKIDFANHLQSSTVNNSVLTEVNNNSNLSPANSLNANNVVDLMSPNLVLNKNLFQMPDGNLIFILPSQCLELANGFENKQCLDAGKSSSSESLGSEQGKDRVVDKPLDFSKNNDESNDSMWRPW